MERRRKFILIIWILVILILSLIPNPEVPRLEKFGLDKVFHFGAYVLLGMIGQAAIGFHSITIGLILGTATELLQHFVPNRAVDFIDWTANVLGLGFGIGTYFIVKKLL